MQRDKGKRGEREAARELSRLFGCEAHRGRQYQGGDDSPDVKVDIPGIHWEVKRTERLNLNAAMDQAIMDSVIDARVDDAPIPHVPVVLSRANVEPWILSVRLNDMPRLATILYLQMQANN